MDYKKAAKIRNKSLLSLMAENKFTHGQGFGSSIGGAISDKFKSKVMGVKEKFTVLNMVRKVTGKGTFGKIATTLVGRALGKSERDISYFGGYGRKGKKYSKKNTNISQLDDNDGESNGKSVAILRDMYEFMQKNYEQEKVRYELDKSSKKELEDEENRKQKHLMDSLVDKKATPEKTNNEGPESFIGGLLTNISKALGFLLMPIIKWAGKLETWISGILDYKKIVKDVTMMVLKSLTTVGSIVRFLGQFILGLIKPPTKAWAIAAAIAAVTLFEYDKWRTHDSRSKEAAYAAKNLSEGPLNKDKKMSKEFTENILPEHAEDYSKGNLKPYDDTIISSGGKRSTILLTDEEKEWLQNTWSNLEKNYKLLDRYSKKEMGKDQNTFDIDYLKQIIVEQELGIAQIQKRGLNRSQISEDKDIFDRLTFTSNQADKVLSAKIAINSSPNASDELDKSFAEKEWDALGKFVDDQIDSSIPAVPAFPKLDLDEFKKVPQFIDDLNNGKFNDTINENIDKVLSNNTVNNIGAGPSKTIDMASIPSRNQDPTYKRGQIGSAQAV